jgi:hypothetical protein
MAVASATVTYRCGSRRLQVLQYPWQYCSTATAMAHGSLPYPMGKQTDPNRHESRRLGTVTLQPP